MNKKFVNSQTEFVFKILSEDKEFGKEPWRRQPFIITSKTLYDELIDFDDRTYYYHQLILNNFFSLVDWDEVADAINKDF